MIPKSTIDKAPSDINLTVTGFSQSPGQAAPTRAQETAEIARMTKASGGAITDGLPKEGEVVPLPRPQAPAAPQQGQDLSFTRVRE